MHWVHSEVISMMRLGGPNSYSMSPETFGSSANTARSGWAIPSAERPPVATCYSSGWNGWIFHLSTSVTLTGARTALSPRAHVALPISPASMWAWSVGPGAASGRRVAGTPYEHFLDERPECRPCRGGAVPAPGKATGADPIHQIGNRSTWNAHTFRLSPQHTRSGALLQASARR